MGTYLDGEALTQAIQDTYQHIIDTKSNKRAADRAYYEELRKKPQLDRVNRAQVELEHAKNALEDAIKGDAELSELRQETKDAAGAVKSAQGTLSSLLLRRAIKGNNKSVDIGTAQPHEIILTAKLGREAPEQLDLFDDDEDDEPEQESML